MSPTTRYSNEEWSSIIASTISAVSDSSDTNKRFPTYDLPSFIPGTIDHTLLKLDATPSQIDNLCAEARVHRFATVCVRPNFVARCVANLKGSGVGVASVVGFHEGTGDLYQKLEDTTLSLSSGATELDTVLNAPHLLAKNYSAIYSELSALRAAAPRATLKVILETSRLNREQIVAGCVLAQAAALDYVKTSTGFLAAQDCIVENNGENGGSSSSSSKARKPTGATIRDIVLMRACCEALASESSALGGHGGVPEAGARKMKVKASGGVRTLTDAVNMLRAGAERLGSSGGVWIAKEGEAVREGERPKGLETRMFSDY